MPVTVRVGAVHLGWDVVSVAAGGGGTPIRPVQVEGTYTAPAYLLADSSGRLHTAGVERQRPDLGMAIADVRDILGHPQIVVAGATWPAELVFRARMYNPLAAIGKYLRGKPDLVALPFPDGWPDEKVDVYVELVEKLDVTVEPLPESVALSGYVRALGLVRSPDDRDPRGIGATGVYSDGRTMLVVAVHGDDDQPTESVDVPVTAEAMRDARSADNVVIEVMAAARSIGADTSTVLLSGNVCFNDALRFAFQNHLGHRLQVADHPMHALVLGAAHLLVTDNESGEPVSAGRHAEPPPLSAQRPVDPAQYRAEAVQQQGFSAQRQAEGGPGYPEQGPGRPAGVPSRPEPAPAHPEPAQPHPPVVQYGPGYPTVQPATEPPASDEQTVRVGRESLPPNLAELGSRFTRPPGQYPDEQRTTGRSAQEPAPLGPRAPYQPSGPPQAGPTQGGPPQAGPDQRGQWHERSAESQDDDEGKPRKGKLWGKLFGPQAIIGAAALAAIAMQSGGDRVELAASVSDSAPVSCPLTPYVTNEQRQGIAAVRGQHDPGLVGDQEPSTPGIDVAGVECAQPSIDNPRYVVPGPPGAIDYGPPIEI